MKKFFLFILIFAILAGGGFGVYTITKQNNKKTIMNNGYVNGNTAGNLYNGGLFCEHNGIIYFANPSDGGKLYSMDTNGKNLKKLTSDSATYINADDNYIYYVRNNTGDNLDFNFVAFHRNALVRVDHDGKNGIVLDTEPSLYAALLGNYIYYIHYDERDASTLYKVRIDGEEQKQVMDSAVFTCSTDKQYFYYNGMDVDGSIHRFDTATDTTTVVYEGNTFQPIISDGNDVYYIDGNSKYSIIHTDLGFSNPTYVTRDSVDSYNVHGDYIYYQGYNKDGSALCMIKTDGTEHMIIKEGDFCDIHVTSSYVFFREYHSGEMYCFARTNPNDVYHFNPGTLK